MPLLFPERVANQDKFFKIVQEQMTGEIKFNGRIGPNSQTYDPAVNRVADGWAGAQSRPHALSFTMEIPWNISASTQEGYLKVGEELGRSIDLYLQSISQPGK